MYNKLVDHLEEDFNSEEKNATVRKNGLNESTVNEDWASPELIKLSDELMPESGAAETVEGELVRALSKVIYRFYNDGDKFYKGYGVETAGAPAVFLMSMAKKLGIAGLAELFSAVAQEKPDDQGYEDFLQKVDKMIAGYVIGKGGKYAPNSYDMLDEPYYEAAMSRWDSREDDEDYEEEDESVKEDQGEIIDIPDDTDAPVREEEAKGVSAEELHNWYLEGSKELDPENFNEEAQVPYESLPEPQRKMDQYIADKINQKLGNVQ